MSAMRLGSGFFASSTNLKLDQHRDAFKMSIPNDWTWFFLRHTQLFLFFQDPTHLVTKWRNRLLSSTADLRLGDYKIDMNHVEKLIDTCAYTKLDHGLTKSDINAKDRQNYASCIRLASDDVINLLGDNVDANGTAIYLKLLRLIVKAYINKSTSVSERRCFCYF
jgi:hypothetical protein